MLERTETLGVLVDKTSGAFGRPPTLPFLAEVKNCGATSQSPPLPPHTSFWRRAEVINHRDTDTEPFGINQTLI
jgi:hypothetical protein